MAKPLDFEHKEYRKNKVKWDLIDAVCDYDGVEKYLIVPNEHDNSDENERRKKQYTKRAVFFNIAGYTCNTLTGMAFRKKPKIEVPEALSYLLEDVDGDDTDLSQQMVDTFEQVLRKGRCILLADMPANVSGATKQDVADRRNVATIKLVQPQNVVNWEKSRINGKNVTSKVVLRDIVEDEDGEDVDQLTHYTLTETGCVVTVYQKKKLDKGYVLIPDMGGTLRSGNGTPKMTIPIQFIGSRNNNEKCDQPPMYHICKINVAHYNNSGIYEDSVFTVGQVQPYMTGMTEEHIKLMSDNNMYIGSRELIGVPSGETFGFSQANPNMLAKEAMDSKENLIVSLGAVMTQQGTAVKTAEQVRSENTASTSIMSLIASNVSAAYKKSIAEVADFMNTDASGTKAEISDEFIAMPANPQMVQSILAAWQGDGIRAKDMVRYFQKVDVIDPEENIDDVVSEIEEGNNEDMPNLDDEV